MSGGKSQNESRSVCWSQKDVMLIGGCCLIDERKEMFTDTTAWLQLPKEQSCKARPDTRYKEYIKLKRESGGGSKEQIK